MNAHDVVVGYLLPPGTQIRAFVWRNEQMHLLDDLLDAASGAGWHFQIAGAIYDDGQICADGNRGTAMLTPIR